MRIEWAHTGSGTNNYSPITELSSSLGKPLRKTKYSLYFFFTFLFCIGVEPVCKCSWFQGDSKGTQPYTYMCPLYPKLPSGPGCHITPSRGPHVIQQVLVKNQALIHHFCLFAFILAMLRHLQDLSSLTRD